MTSGPEPYAEIASFYEAEFGGVDTDIRYFSRNLGSGPLAVLGCGTGRIGRVLGGQRTVVGLDRSLAMLALARTLSPDATYVQGDMTTFSLRDLGLRQVAEILVPNAAFNFLATRADQERCLQACARALEPGARLVLDMPLPDFALLGIPHSPEKLAWSGTIDGKAVQRYREVWRYPVRQKIVMMDRFCLEEGTVATSRLELRWVLAMEIEWMLEACGFVVDVLHGDYAGRALDDGSTRLIVHGIRV